MFTTHGLPQLIVSNNGPTFTSSEFEEFLMKNGIHHVKSAPYHAASNRLAERYVQTFKSFLKKCSGNDLQVSQFLFQYHFTLHSTTGVSPAQLLMGRRLLTRLDCMRPSMASLGATFLNYPFRHTC